MRKRRDPSKLRKELKKLPASRAAAITAGEPYYFSGRACRKGHVDKRQTLTGTCYSCMLENARRMSEKIREKFRMIRREKLATM